MRRLGEGGGGRGTERRGCFTAKGISDSVEKFLLCPNPTREDTVARCVDKTQSSAFLSFARALKSVMLGVSCLFSDSTMDFYISRIKLFLGIQA